MPRRTVFRYLRALSEANIPVYYDREYAGYRLLNTVGLQLDTLSLQETVLLAMCLSIAGSAVNTTYRQDIVKLAAKVMTRQQFGCELLPTLATKSEDPQSTTAMAFDRTDTLTLALIQAANASGKDLVIHLAPKVGHLENRIVIPVPGISFEKEWVVFSREKDNRIRIPFEDIVYVQIEP